MHFVSHIFIKANTTLLARGSIHHNSLSFIAIYHCVYVLQITACQHFTCNRSVSLKVYLRMSFINFCKLSLRSCGPTRVCVAKSLIKWKSDRISSDNPKIHYKRRTFQLFLRLSPQGNGAHKEFKDPLWNNTAYSSKSL